MRYYPVKLSETWGFFDFSHFCCRAVDWSGYTDETRDRLLSEFLCVFSAQGSWVCRDLCRALP